jgi:hypothetical protein
MRFDGFRQSRLSLYIHPADAPHMARILSARHEFREHGLLERRTVAVNQDADGEEPVDERIGHDEEAEAQRR